MPSDNGSLTLRVRSYGDLWGQETMLLAVELVAALFFGFVPRPHLGNSTTHHPGRAR